MNKLRIDTKSTRALAKLRFKVLGLATIKNIPTDQFHSLIKTMIRDGWQKQSEYTGFDAWIDYGRVKIRRGRTCLKFEWDNWTEGSIEGPLSTIESIAKTAGLPVTNEWRWSEYDDNHRNT